MIVSFAKQMLLFYWTELTVFAHTTHPEISYCRLFFLQIIGYKINIVHTMGTHKNVFDHFCASKCKLYRIVVIFEELYRNKYISIFIFYNFNASVRLNCAFIMYIVWLYWVEMFPKLEINVIWFCQLLMCSHSSN